MELPAVSFRVKCSSGTYIRSLAHSLGMRLGCGAVLTELIREYSHPFTLDEAVTLEELTESPERLARRIAPLQGNGTKPSIPPSPPSASADRSSEARGRSTRRQLILHLAWSMATPR